jgi:hypothetical protein
VILDCLLEEEKKTKEQEKQMTEGNRRVTENDVDERKSFSTGP